MIDLTHSQIQNWIRDEMRSREIPLHAHNIILFWERLESITIINVDRFITLNLADPKMFEKIESMLGDDINEC